MHATNQLLEERIKQGKVECIKLHALNWFENGEHEEYRFTPENVVELVRDKVVIVRDRVETIIYIPRNQMGEYFKYLRKKLGLPATKRNYNKYGFTRSWEKNKEYDYYRLIIENGFEC